MRFWNLHDSDLAIRLQDAISVDGVSFEIGHEGGVAVFLDGYFVGIWAELQRCAFSFIPAGYLQPTRECLPLDRVADITLELLAQERTARRKRCIA